ncbi:MAG TPA: response regulator [Bryobacteraceae bacterium]|nr:response regulator [Bryobacteraceae bacterium]
MSETLDLNKPEAVARLRHELRTSLNVIIGYAGIVRRQAADQSATAEAGLMEQVLAAARHIEAMVQEALPPARHVTDGSLPRLRHAMQAGLGRITSAVARFEELTASACAAEIGKIRAAVTDLSAFARGAEGRQPAARVLVTPPPEESAPESSPRAIPSSTGDRPFAGCRILLVEEDAYERDLLQRRLEIEGFEVAAEPDSRALFERLRTEVCDVVLLDIAAQGDRGFQALEALRASPGLREIPVIALAPEDGRRHAARAIEMGADEFLLKPLDTPLLRARIAAMLRRRRSEAEHDELARRLDVLLELTREGICGLDPAGRCIFINRAALEMLGHSRESILGRSLHETVHHSRPDGSPYPADECPMNLAVQTGQFRHGSGECFFRADGSSFPVEYSIQPVRRGGVTEGSVVTFTDISERQRNEEHLVQAAKLESVGLLAGGIAHDFNNILTGVLGNASLVLDSLAEDDPNRSLLAEVVKSSERAADLTRQMLAFAGKGQFVLEPVDISHAIQDIAELLGASIPKSARLELRLAPNLPKFQADPRQLQQLALNLVINAGEATEGRDGRIAVESGIRDFAEPVSAHGTFGAIESGRYVYLAVSDNGVGMDDATRLRIFDPFFSTKFTGRGLGLAAAMGIVRAHQGAIRVEGRSGEGSRFEALFPVPAAEPAPQPPPHTAATAAARTGQTILVVDDEDIVRRTTSSVLERKGYRVLLAENGREAVDIFRAHAGRIALVLLDLTMPVMGGDEAARYLRTIRHDVPILVSSGYPESEVARRFSGIRIRGFVRKPYTAASLIEKIQAALQ